MKIEFNRETAKLLDQYPDDKIKLYFDNGQICLLSDVNHPLAICTHIEIIGEENGTKIQS